MVDTNVKDISKEDVMFPLWQRLSQQRDEETSMTTMVMSGMSA